MGPLLSTTLVEPREDQPATGLTNDQEPRDEQSESQAMLSGKVDKDTESTRHLESNYGLDHKRKNRRRPFSIAEQRLASAPAPAATKFRNGRTDTPAVPIHPRNRYAERPPDFAELAVNDQVLAECLVIDRKTGRPSLDFADPRSVKALTCALLKAHWDLDIDFPLESLCPTVTNRLNYLLEVEDLLRIAGCHGSATLLDIGTGFTCIYPLLGCRLRSNWRFIATEIDAVAVACATANVARNHLADRIRVIHTTPTASFYASIAGPGTVITAVMCNPPFYSSAEHRKAASDAKRKLHPATPGTTSEMVTEGGEVTFVQRMMRESVDAAHNVVVFSAMVGFKSSIAALRETANELAIPCFFVRSLHQGRTVRWVVAWSFSPSLRDRTCRLLTVPAERELTVLQLRAILDSVDIVVATEGDDWLEFTVQEPTWTRAYKRRKMRHDESVEHGKGSKEAICLWWARRERPSGQPETGITAVWIAGPRDSAVFTSFMTFVTNQIGK